MTTARQRLAKHVPKRYAVNKNIRPLLENGCSYHGSRQGSASTRTWTTVLEPFKAVISIRFAQGCKRRPEETKRQCELERECDLVSHKN
jgi:anti-sigma factor RsiW